MDRRLLAMRDVSEVVGDSCDAFVLLFLHSANHRERSGQAVGVHIFAIVSSSASEDVGNCARRRPMPVAEEDVGLDRRVIVSGGG